MQIRTRLTLQFIIVVTLIIVLSFGLIYYSSSLYRKREFYQRLDKKALTAIDMLVTMKAIDSAMVSIFDKVQKDKFPQENISIYNTYNTEIYTNNDTINYQPDETLFKEIRLTGRKEFTSFGHEVLGINYKTGNGQYVIVAGAYDKEGFSNLDNLKSTMILLFFITITVVAVAGWLYAGRVLKPLKNVIGEVRNLNVNRLEVRLKRDKNNDEITQLIGTFNGLLSRIEEALKLQKLFVTGVSHELKNPLTSITSQLQVVLIKDRSAEEYKKIIQSILEDIKNLNKTTIDLIEYARLNSENNITTAKVRTDELLWFSKDYFSKNHPDYRVNLNIPHMPEDEKRLIVEGNEPLLKIALVNLIDNACKFSNEKECRVQLDVSSGVVSIQVSDRGIGMGAEEIKYIFEPFYRSNNTAEVRGHGIGLALVKKIVQLHNAEIKVESEKNVGSCFRLSFKVETF